jgi:hypothetical protein
MARGEHAVLGFINESNAGNFPKQLERRAGESANGAKPHSLGSLDLAGLALIIACHRPARPPRLVGDDFQSAADDLVVESLRHRRRTSNVALGSVHIPVGSMAISSVAPAPIGRARAYAWQGQRHANFLRFHGPRVFFAAGYPYYDYDYVAYGYGGCGYLYRRAVATGSSYWWHRYRACRY